MDNKSIVDLVKMKSNTFTPCESEVKLLDYTNEQINLMYNEDINSC